MTGYYEPQQKKWERWTWWHLVPEAARDINCRKGKSPLCAAHSSASCIVTGSSTRGRCSKKLPSAFRQAEAEGTALRLVRQPADSGASSPFLGWGGRNPAELWWLNWMAEVEGWVASSDQWRHRFLCCLSVGCTCIWVQSLSYYQHLLKEKLMTVILWAQAKQPVVAFSLGLRVQWSSLSLCPPFA